MENLYHMHYGRKVSCTIFSLLPAICSITYVSRKGDNNTYGAGGMVFCDLAWSNPDDVDRFGDCYDRDFSRIDCDEHPNHSRCTGFGGRNGLIFCDVAYEDLGYKPGCYDRYDNPTNYCDNYAKEESGQEWTAEFCQSICDNSEGVIGREEPCTN